jgi:hypothetical protein
MQNVGPKLFCEIKLTCFDSFSFNFNLQAHILNTSGIAFKPKYST